jgi:hypothetical protein
MTFEDKRTEYIQNEQKETPKQGRFLYLLVRLAKYGIITYPGSNIPANVSQSISTAMINLISKT